MDIKKNTGSCVVRWRCFFGLCVLSVLFLALGFLAGRFYPTLNSAVQTVATNQKTWRLQYFPTNAVDGREGIWVTLFKPRYTGSIVYVTYLSKKSGALYYLLTRQSRVYQGKQQSVIEPAAGFFNGEYLGRLSHVTVEQAEKEIEQARRLDKSISIVDTYQRAKRNTETGKLDRLHYVEDHNLWDTAFRELTEETGLDILSLRKLPHLKIHQDTIGEYEVKDVYVSVKLVQLVGDELEPPVLRRQFPSEEVEWAGWVQKNSIDFSTGSVQTDKGIYPLYADERIKKTFAMALSKENQS